MNSLGYATVLFAAYSVYRWIFVGFPTEFFILLQRCLHQIFVAIVWIVHINSIGGILIAVKVSDTPGAGNPHFRNLQTIANDVRKAEKA